MHTDYHCIIDLVTYFSGLKWFNIEWRVVVEPKRVRRIGVWFRRGSKKLLSFQKQIWVFYGLGASFFISFSTHFAKLIKWKTTSKVDV